MHLVLFEAIRVHNFRLITLVLQFAHSLPQIPHWGEYRIQLQKAIRDIVPNSKQDAPTPDPNAVMALLDRLLFPTPKDFINHHDSRGYTPLILAADLGQWVTVRHLLMVPGISVNAQDLESGWTALHCACYRGHMLVIRELLNDRRVNSGLLDHEQRTALELLSQVHLDKWSDVTEQRPVYADGARPSRYRQLHSRIYLSPTPDGTLDHPKLVLGGQTNLFTWGYNLNYTLGFPDQQDRTKPEKLSIPVPPVSRPTDPDIRDLVHTVDRSKGFLSVHRDATTDQVLTSTHWNVQQVCMSHFHSAVVTSAEHDNVYMCGFGRSGRLANSLDTCPQLRRVQGLRHRIVQVALGRDHTVFLTSRGEVLTCGSNRYGQLGRKATQIADDEPVQLTPRTVPPPTRSFRAQGVAAAGYYTVVYNSDSMYTCGADQGQLGYRVDPQSNPWATDLVEPSLLSEFSELSLVTSPSSPHRGQQLAYQATLRQVTCFAADTQFISVVASEGALVCLLATNEVQILTKARSQMISLASGPTLIDGVRITHFHSRYVAPKPMEIATGERGLVAIVTNTGHIHVAHLPREFTADAPLSTTRDSSATMRQGPIFTPSRSHGAVRVWSALSDSLFAQKVAIGKGGTLILVTRNQRAYVGTLYRLPASSPLQCFYRFSLIPDLCYVTQVAANALGGFAAVQSTTRFAGDAPSVKDIGTRVRHTALLSPLGISGQRSVSLTELCHRDILHAHLRPTTRKTVSPDTPALHSFAQEEVSWRTLLRLKPPMVLYSELSDMVWATTTGDAVEVHTLRVASALPLFWHSVVTQLKCLSSPDTAGEQAAGFTVQVVDPSSSELPIPTECPPSLTRTAPFIYIHFHHCPFSVLAAIAYTLYQDTFPDGLPSDCHAMARRIRKAWQGDQAPIDSPLSACSLATTFNHLMVAVLRHITLPAGEAMLPPPLATLLQQRQWNTQEVICGYFDVVLRLQDALVPCHRWPLATGSAFFAMLLSPVSPWAHSSSASPVSHYSHSVNLTHVRWKTFFPVLVALYRGAQEDSLCAFPCEDTEQYLDYVLEVMSLADELDVPHLFRQCESTLVGLISIRTVIRFLDFTQRVIAPTLARCCEQFLRQHLLIFAERRALDQVPSPVLHHLTSPWGVENITCSNRQYAGSCHVESPDSPSCAVEAWAPTEKEWGEIVQFAYRQDLIGTTTLKSPRHAFTSGKSSPGRQRWQVEKTTQVSPSKEGIFSMDDEVNSSPVITHSPKPRRWLTLSPNGPRSPSGDRCPVSWQSSPITKVSLHTIVAEQQKQHNGDQPHPRQNVSIPTGLGTGNRIISFSPPGSAPLEPLAPQPHRSSQRQRRRQYQQQHSQSQKASGESSKTTWAQAAQPEESKSGNSPPTVLHPVPLTTRKAGSSRSQPGSKRILPNLPTASSLAIIQEEQAAENKRVEAKAQRVVQKGLSSIQREERARFEIGQYYALHSNTRAGEWFVLQ